MDNDETATDGEARFFEFWEYEYLFIAINLVFTLTRVVAPVRVADMV